MQLLPLIERLGDAGAASAAGLALGAAFGVAAERSRFCLRAAAVEFGRHQTGPRFAVWLLAFSTALFWTQALVAAGAVDLGESRWLATPGSISGAILGGLVFGLGMVLARGCPGRLLVLGATGNLRAILSGLVFAVVAQMSLRGAFAEARSALATPWVTAGPNPRLLDLAGLPDWVGLAFGAAAAALALGVAWRSRVSLGTLVFGSGVGFTVAAGWYLTYSLSRLTFEPTAIESLSFSGPSADTLMFLLVPDPALDFDVGLVPGVALGAFLSAWIARRLAWQGWEGARSMQRYLLGAGLMGFGAMLAGGCTIGAGVTGGSTFAMTAWIALTSMWVGGMAADRLIDGAGAAPRPETPATPAT